MRYIRQRKNGNYQFRYRDLISFTHPDIDTVVSIRNDYLGYNPDIDPISHKQPKILILDIETAPIIAYVWGLYDQNIGLNQIKEDWYLLCFAYKWLEDRRSKFLGLCDFEGYRSGNDKECKLVQALYELLDSADVVVAHNAIQFDIKRINAKFLQYDLPRPGLYKVVDTLKIARANFKLTSNKLDYVSRFLGREGKLKHEGMDLWIGCMQGDKTCWRKMREYNLQDVVALEQVYLMLRGWDKSHPNLAHYYDNNLLRCTVCGSDNIELMDKDAYTSLSYSAWRCIDCGHIMRERKTKTVDSSKLLVNAQ